jgi:DUF2892 family protein
MVRNLGYFERAVRLIAGALILGLYGAVPEPWRFLTLIGLAPLGTALLGYCPVYQRLGWKGGPP